MNHLRCVCIIPARGGSRRIPRKNVLPLNGKPLLAYTIEAVLEAGAFDDVVVSSDDVEILDVARRHGAEVDERPVHLAGDRVRAVEVVAEFLERKGGGDAWDVVGMCLPTCPLREAGDVRGAVDRFLAIMDRCPRLIGVTPCDFPPQLALRALDEPGFMDMREPAAYGFSTRSQDNEPLYFPNGSIYLSTVERYLADKTFFGRPMGAYVMPAERSLDIDYPYQFAIVEALLRDRARGAEETR